MNNVEAQEGNYLALTWSEPAEGVTSVKAGLQPSDEELIEVIDDPDRNHVFRVQNINQKFIIQQTKGTNVETQEFDLSGLILEPAE